MEPITPIPARTSAEESEALRALLATAPPTVLVASDLHLGDGRDPDTGAFYLTENFRADDAFARWLAHYRADRNAPHLLVLNGDIFDFLRVTRVPRTPREFDAWAERLVQLGAPDRAERVRDVERVERSYGFRTHDYKSVWKLLAMVASHETFFQALAEWITAGHGLVFVAGNHDLELHWPLVRRALRDELVRRGVPGATGARCVTFADGGLTLNNLYIEHGHQHEPMTRVEGGTVLEGDPSQLNLPLGSFINRYFINRIELLDPFIDNIKPVTGAMLALLRRYPASIVGTYIRAWRFVWRAIQARRFLNGAVLTILAALLVPVATIALFIAARRWPELAGWLQSLRSWLETTQGQIAAVLGVLFPVLLPYLIGFLGQLLREILRVFGLRKSRDRLAENAPEVVSREFPAEQRHRRVYAVMGHTHVQAVRRLAANGREAFYVNTGTWIALWPRDRPDLIGKVFYSFARFDRAPDGEYRHAALIWDDQAEESRPAPILIRTSE